MRKLVLSLIVSAVLLSLAGCQPAAKEYLVVDFKPQKPLTYKLISQRDVQLKLDSTGKSKPEVISEKLEMIVSYRPVGIVDGYGQKTIEANCISAKATRKGKGASSNDVVNSLTGKSYTFKISPSGKITDFANMTALAKSLGRQTIQKRGKQGSIKSPDMIADFAALQWHLWDAVSSVENPLEGIKPGQSWSSKQFVPLPVPVGFARISTHTFTGNLSDDSLYQDDQKRIVIDSTYQLGEGPVDNWPKIYTGGFNMKGTFGILRGFRMLSLDGTGNMIFNVDRGIIEKDVQQYKADLSAEFLLPLAGTSPSLSVDQKITVELMEN